MKRSPRATSYVQLFSMEPEMEEKEECGMIRDKGLN
jgi:hypothetical protein